LPIDGNSFSAKAREEAIQVLDAVVNHERRAVFTEVLRVAGKDRPDGVPFDLALLPATPREEDHRVLDVHPQVKAIPLDHRVRILRFEEDASEACHAGSALSCDHAPGVVSDGYEGEVGRSLSGYAVPTAFASVRIGFIKRGEKSVTTLSPRSTQNKLRIDWEKDPR